MGDLTYKQQIALAALLDGANIQDAAGVAKVNRKTVSKWLGEPAFSAAYRNASDAALGLAARRLVSATAGAVDFLMSVCQDTSAPVGVRLRAADLTLQHTWRAKDIADFSERLTELERRLGKL